MGKKLDQCHSYKYLGVYIDDNLTWKPHITHICKKVAKACGYLAKLRHCIKIDALIGVYYALIHSYLRYGITSWGNASTTVMGPLTSLVTRAVRIMTFAPLGNIDVKSIYKYLNILEIPQLFSLETGKFIYKSENGLLPPVNIAKHFELRNANANHHHWMRDHGIHLQTISCEKSHGDKSIQKRGAKLWNDLSDELRNSDSLQIFKKHYKEFLIEDNHQDDDQIYIYY